MPAQEMKGMIDRKGEPWWVYITSVEYDLFGEMADWKMKASALFSFRELKIESNVM